MNVPAASRLAHSMVVPGEKDMVMPQVVELERGGQCRFRITDTESEILLVLDLDGVDFSSGIETLSYRVLLNGGNIPLEKADERQSSKWVPEVRHLRFKNPGVHYP